MALEQTTWAILLEFQRHVEVIRQLENLENALRNLSKFSEVPASLAPVSSEINKAIKGNKALLESFKQISAEVDKVASREVAATTKASLGFEKQRKDIQFTINALQDLGKRISSLPPQPELFKKAASREFVGDIKQINKLLGQKIPTDKFEALKLVQEKINSLIVQQKDLISQSVGPLKQVASLFKEQEVTIDGVKVKSIGLANIVERIGDALKGKTALTFKDLASHFDKMSNQLTSLKTIFSQFIKTASDPKAAEQAKALLANINNILAPVNKLRDAFSKLEKSRLMGEKPTKEPKVKKVVQEVTVDTKTKADISKAEKETKEVKGKVKKVIEDKTKEPIKTTQEAIVDSKTKLDTKKVSDEAQKSKKKVKEVTEKETKKPSKSVQDVTIETKAKVKELDTKSIKGQRKKIEKQLDEISKKEKTIQEVKIETKAIADTAQTESEIKKARKQIEDKISRVTKDEIKGKQQAKISTKLVGVDPILSQIQKLQSEAGARPIFMGATGIAKDITAQANAMNKQEKDVNKLTEALVRYKLLQKELKGLTKDKNIFATFQQNTKAAQDFRNAMAKLDDSIGNISAKKRRLINEARALQSAQEGAAGATDNLTSMMENSIAKVIRYRIAYLTMRTAIRGVKAAIQEFIDVQFELAKVAIVLDPVSGNIKDLQKQAFIMARQFGVGVKDVVASYKLWAQQGLKQNEILTLTKAVLLGVNTTGLEAVDVTQALTSAIFTYNQSAEEAARLVDKWMRVQAKFPVEARDLVLAMETIGASAAEVGIDLDDLGGIVTAINAITRKSGRAIGNSLKTMFARVANKEVLISLQNVGVALFKSEGEFRDFSDVLTDLAGKWDTLSDAQRLNVAKSVGGIRHYVDFIALMNNFAVAQEATRESLFASNDALDANKIIMETVNKSLASFMANVEQLAFVLGKDLSNVVANVAAVLQLLVGALKTPVFGKLASSAIILGSALIGLKIAVVALNLGIDLLKKHVFTAAGAASVSRLSFANLTVQTNLLKVSAITAGQGIMSMTFAMQAARVSAIGLGFALKAAIPIFAALSILQVVLGKGGDTIVDSTNNIVEAMDTQVETMAKQVGAVQSVIDRLKELKEAQERNLKSGKPLIEINKRQQEIYSNLATIIPQAKKAFSSYVIQLEASNKFSEKGVKSTSELAKYQLKLNEAIAKDIQQRTVSNTIIDQHIGKLERENQLIRENIDATIARTEAEQAPQRAKLIEAAEALSEALSVPEERLKALSKSIAIAMDNASLKIDFARVLVGDFNKIVDESKNKLDELRDAELIDEGTLKSSKESINAFGEEVTRLTKKLFDPKVKTEVKKNVLFELGQQLTRFGENLSRIKGIPADKIASFDDLLKRLNDIKTSFNKPPDPSLIVSVMSEVFLEVDRLSAELDTTLKKARTGALLVLQESKFIEQFGIGTDVLQELVRFFDQQEKNLDSSLSKVEEKVQDTINTIDSLIKQLNRKDLAPDLRKTYDEDLKKNKLIKEELLKVQTVYQAQYNILKPRLLTAHGELLAAIEAQERAASNLSIELERFSRQTEDAAISMKLMGAREEEILGFEIRRKIESQRIVIEQLKQAKLTERSLQAIKDSGKIIAEIEKDIAKLAQIRIDKNFQKVVDGAREFQNIITSSISSFDTGLTDFFKEQQDINKRIKDEQKALNEARIQGDNDAADNALFHIKQLRDQQNEMLAGWKAMQRVITNLFSGISKSFTDSLAKNLAESLANIKIKGKTLDIKFGEAISNANKELLDGLRLGNDDYLTRLHSENVFLTNEIRSIFGKFIKDLEVKTPEEIVGLTLGGAPSRAPAATETVIDIAKNKEVFDIWKAAAEDFRKTPELVGVSFGQMTDKANTTSEALNNVAQSAFNLQEQFDSMGSLPMSSTRTSQEILDEENKRALKDNTKALLKHMGVQLATSQLLFKAFGKFTPTMQSFSTVFGEFLPVLLDLPTKGIGGGILGLGLSLLGGVIGSIFDDTNKELEDLSSVTQDNTKAVLENTNTLEELNSSIFNAPPRFVLPATRGQLFTSGGNENNISVQFNNTFQVPQGASVDEIAKVITIQLSRQFRTGLRTIGARSELF